MEIRSVLQEDIDAINTWYHERKAQSFPISSLPPVGLIIPGIAVGFLVQTDAGYGILEPFISNPRASKEDREIGLNSILHELTEYAQFLGLSTVFGFSTSKSMLSKALEQGFSVIETNSTTVYKELK